MTEAAKNVKRSAALLLIAAIAALPLLTSRLAAQSKRAHEVGMKLKCMCRGCDMPAGNCSHPGGAFSGPCDTAKSQLREIDDMLAKGQNEKQIIDAFVAEYTTAVYVEPPQKGVGLLAWLMPVFYALVGLGLVLFVVRKWRHRAVATVPAAGPGPGIATDALARARAQAARDTED